MRLYSTLSGRAEELPPPPYTVALYVCGVTPYDDAHLGHAMSYIIFDVLRRYLEHEGYGVRHVQNFTDIDDRIIERAARRGEEPLALA
jgi:cysteinyl-tRNA synthetase